MTIVGIDPGVTGGLAALGNVVVLVPMPAVAGEPNAREVAIWLQGIAPDHVFIERAQSFPKQGVVSAFRYGTGYGMLRGICASLALPYTLVAPAKWHREIIGLSKDGTPKDRALAAALRLFPGVNLRAPERSKKCHEGLVDALLIAEFGRRVLLVGANPEDFEKE